MEAGTSNRDMARRFDLSKSAVDRHRRYCLPGIRERAREVRAIEKNLAVVPPEERSSFIERVEDHTLKMEMVRDSAIRRNDNKEAIAAAREVRGAYEVLGKATGEFQPMFGPAEHRPLFVLPEGARISVTVNQPCLPVSQSTDKLPTDKVIEADVTAVPDESEHGKER